MPVHNAPYVGEGHNPPGCKLGECCMVLPARKTTRIPDYDYSLQNYYFLTICTYEKKCIFYTDRELNNHGKTAGMLLEQIPEHFPGVRVDKWVVMPNHVHLILAIETRQCASAITIIGLYKSSVTKEIHETDPNLSVWQRSFHDHIIRNKRQYDEIWHYIDTNLLRWEDDCFHPVNDESHISIKIQNR